MNEHEILQSFFRNSDGTWTPLKTVAVAGTTMEPGTVFFSEHLIQRDKCCRIS
jgi:hypothetical protein